MKNNKAMLGFAVYVTAPERLDMRGGTAAAAEDIKEGLSEGRPVVFDLSDVRVVSAAGAQLIISLYNHHADDVSFDGVTPDIIDALVCIGADTTMINRLKEQA